MCGRAFRRVQLAPRSDVATPDERFAWACNRRNHWPRALALASLIPQCVLRFRPVDGHGSIG